MKNKINTFFNKGLELLNIIFIQSLIYLIAKIVPKDRELIVIGTSLGRHFSDNPKYLYLYFHQNIQNKNKMIWITKNKEVNSFLKSVNLPSEYLYSFKGIFYTIRASKVFISHNMKDIQGALIGGAEIIQLWHGQPLRKIGFNGEWFSRDLKGKLKVKFYNLFPFSYYMKCDKVMVFSNMGKEIFQEAFKYSFRNKKISENILMLGQSRNSVLNKNYIFNEIIFPEVKELQSYQKKYNMIIAWLPTHRLQSNKTIVDLLKESNINLDTFNTFCQKYNILFVIKAHFLELNLINDLIKGRSNIISYNVADPYPLLHFTDILITDYSSVYFDFLITNRPIIFAPFDFNEYEKKSKFYYDYNKVTPGKKCMNWEEIENEILALLNGNDMFKIDREKLSTNTKFILEDNSKNIIEYFGLSIQKEYK